MDTPVSASVPADLHCGSVRVEDTFAEAFPMTATRLIVTACSPHWALVAARTFCGYATSVIGCDLETAVERVLATEETPDGRPGVSILAFAFSRDRLAAALVNRVGQCLLTCPTTACFNGLESARDREVSVGGQLRFFGDGYQSSKVIAGRRYWRVPVMDGEFLCEDRFGTTKGVAGGNLLIGGATPTATLLAAEQAVAAMGRVADVICPFPAGVVRSGSKVGSRYKTLRASTNDAYCPSLVGRTRSELPDGVGAMYEIVIDGLTEQAVAAAMQAGLYAAAELEGIRWITAGNYGGKLGPFHFHLRDLLTSAESPA